MTPLPPPLRDRLLAHVASRPSPNRTDRVRRGWFLSIAAAFVVVAIVLHAGPDIHVRTPAIIVTCAGLTLAVAIAASWWTLSTAKSMLGRPRPWLRAMAWLVPAAWVATFALVNLVWPERAVAWSLGNLEPHFHIPCVENTLLLAVAPFAAVFVARWRSDPVAPATTGAALGTVAGAWAVVAITLVCPRVDLLHVMVAHLLPAACLVVMGTALGTWALGLRWKRSR